ncbi:PilZ domain-containing protein [Thiomicrorhabdus sp. Kp2]|uniref:PilZ domain-containing protein n=1 Tax=Thiomicrorhabdus sp. Kp2 TaxID=1123518 RepID=UPI000592A2BB|nr:PilZ domain-containing protein [Thiomicrorhabdus sp. Kp2]
MHLIKPTEKRCRDRLSLNRKVILTSGENTLYNLKMVDLSTCGLGLLSPKPINEDNLVSLQFSLPAYDQNSNINILGKIMHTTQVNRQYLLGIEFQRLTAHDILVMKEFFIYHNRFNA